MWDVDGVRQTMHGQAEAIRSGSTSKRLRKKTRMKENPFQQVYVRTGASHGQLHVSRHRLVAGPTPTPRAFQLGWPVGMSFGG